MSRMRYIAAVLQQPIRFVGLSTALANAADLADWLGISPKVSAAALADRGVCRAAGASLLMCILACS